jgi:outer membrane receptor protein involved in Fe transport
LKYPPFLGNPKLLPERIGTLDLQATYQGNRLQASVGYFHSVENALIVQDLSSFPGHAVNLAAPATFQ